MARSLGVNICSSRSDESPCCFTPNGACLRGDEALSGWEACPHITLSIFHTLKVHNDSHPVASVACIFDEVKAGYGKQAPHWAPASRNPRTCQGVSHCQPNEAELCLPTVEMWQAGIHARDTQHYPVPPPLLSERIQRVCVEWTLLICPCAFNLHLKLSPWWGLLL